MFGWLAEFFALVRVWGILGWAWPILCMGLALGASGFAPGCFLGFVPLGVFFFI